MMGTKKAKCLFILLLLLISIHARKKNRTSTNKFADICYSLRNFGQDANSNTYEGSLIADFPEREAFLKEYLRTTFDCGSTWGTEAPRFPQPFIPCFVEDQAKWMRDRVVALAKSYIGFPFKHHHIPTWFSEETGCGVDCSNFTAWVYNFGLGIYFPSNIVSQADGPEAPGRILVKGEPLLPGDILFLKGAGKATFSHAAIFLDVDTILDSTGTQVAIRTRNGAKFARYESYEFARRIIE